MKKIVTALVGAVVLAVGVGGAVLLVALRRKPPEKAVELKAPLVVTARAARGSHRVTVEGTGIVTAAEEVTLHPQVTGLVVKQNAALAPGGLIPRGAVVAEIDPRDYALAVEREKGEVARARYELALEQGRQTVARHEWALLGEDVAGDQATRDLALRVPHLAHAKATLASATSRLQRAELDLERTVIRAPFNALVREESVDTGQLVTPQSPLATLVGTDRFWVRVSLPVDKLAFVRIPGRNGCAAGAGSPCAVALRTNQTGALRGAWRAC
jgi:multidrug resistance efflux pump